MHIRVVFVIAVLASYLSLLVLIVGRIIRTSIGKYRRSLNVIRDKSHRDIPSSIAASFRVDPLHARSVSTLHPRVESQLFVEWCIPNCQNVCKTPRESRVTFHARVIRLNMPSRRNHEQKVTGSNSEFTYIFQRLQVCMLLSLVRSSDWSFALLKRFAHFQIYIHFFVYL